MFLLSNTHILLGFGWLEDLYFLQKSSYVKLVSEKLYNLSTYIIVAFFKNLIEIDHAIIIAAPSCSITCWVYFIEVFMYDPQGCKARTTSLNEEKNPNLQIWRW